MDTKTRTPKVGGRIWHHEPRIAAATVKTNSSCFPHHWLFMSYPCGFVNTCVCTLLSVGSGCRQRHVYRIYEDFKKSKPTCKISLLLFKTKKLMSSRMCQPFCQNVDFLGGSRNYCCTLLLWWQKTKQKSTTDHNEAQSVFVGWGGRRVRTSQNQWRSWTPQECFPVFFCCPPTRVEERRLWSVSEASSSPLLSSSLLSSRDCLLQLWDINLHNILLPTKKTRKKMSVD